MKNPRVYGSAPFKVAVIHGGPGAPGTVAPIARELSRDWGVLEPIQTRKSVDGQIEELYQLLKSRGDLPMVLIGHSWGAWLAYLTAARYPEAVYKLILVSSGPFSEEFAVDILQTRLSRLSPAERDELDALLRALQSPDHGEQGAKLARVAALVDRTDNYAPLEPEGEDPDRTAVDGAAFQAVWQEAAGLRKSGQLLGKAKDIKCPVVAIHGDYDPHPAAGVRIPLKQAIAEFTFHLLRRCGHSPWKERYARTSFFELLRQELQNL